MLVLAGVLGGDDGHRPVAERKDLRVEGVGADGALRGELAEGRAHDEELVAQAAAQVVDEARVVGERELVQHEEAPRAHRHDVGVERAGVDAVGVLLREEAHAGVEAVEAREGLARLARLARRVAPRAGEGAPRRAPPREDVGRPARRDEPRVVGRAFVGELPAAGQRLVHGEPRLVGEDGAKDARRRRRLDGAVEHLLEVRRREMDAAVACVARRRDGGGVRGPHRRRARADAEVEAVARRGGCDDLLVLPREPQTPERREARPVVRRQHRLRDAEPYHEAHLLEPLPRRRPRVGHLPAVRRARDVPRAQPAVVVRGPHQPVELDLPKHAALLIPSFWARCTPAVTHRRESRQGATTAKVDWVLTHCERLGPARTLFSASTQPKKTWRSWRPGGPPFCGAQGVFRGSGAPYIGRGSGSGVVRVSLGRMPARSPMTTSFSSAKTVSLPKNV